MLEFKEFSAALNMVAVRMCESHYVEIVAFGLLEFFFESRVQINLWRFRIFSILPVTVVQQYAPPV